MTAPVPPRGSNPPGGALPPGPPYTAAVVEDVHAGVYPEAVTAVLRYRMAADPEASALLAALDSTVADLAAWQEPPPIPMPEAYVARLDAAIAGESAARSAGAAHVAALPDAPIRPVSAPPAGRSPSSTGPVGSGPGRVSSLDQARSRRSRRWATGLGIAAAIAAVVTVGAIALRPSATGGTSEAGSAIPTSSTSQPSATSAPGGSPAPTQQAVVADPNHLETLLTQITGTASAGPYSDPARLSACLAANGVTGTNVLGVIPVIYQGHSAYAISLGLDQATARILIVGDSCGAPGADLLTSQTSGR